MKRKDGINNLKDYLKVHLITVGTSMCLSVLSVGTDTR